MEEIIKRLKILKLSIELKDIQSIDLQIERLESLNINQQVKNILALIRNGHNYKAVMSINAYPNELYTNEYYSKVKAEEEAVIEEFGLFENTPSGASNIVVQNPVVEKIESEKEILEELKEEEAQLHKIEKEEEEIEKEEPTIIKNSWFVEEEEKIEEDIIDKEDKELEEEIEKVEDSEEESKEELEKIEEDIEDKEPDKELEEETIEKDIEKEELEEESITEDDKDKIDLNDGLEESNNYNSWYYDNKLENQIDDTNPLSYTKDYTFEEETEEDDKTQESNTYAHDLIIEDDDLDDIAKDYYRQKIQEDKEKNSTSTEDNKEEALLNEDGLYQPIAFLEQKFENIIKRFPQKESIESELDSIKHLIAMFEQPYSDKDIEIALKQFDEFKRNGDLEEASKILLLVSISDAKSAHFALSRELFKGDVLEQNYPEAFIQMNDLALDGFVEAICDLGQFYEYGIGVKKDRKKAISLYEEAMESDLERAKELRDKLQNSKRSFFSYLFD